ncbi:hypothetical protein ACLMJK_003973 [Lecanora helva]
MNHSRELSKKSPSKEIPQVLLDLYFGSLTITCVPIKALILGINAIAWRKLNIKRARVPYLFRSYRHPKSIKPDILERNPDGPDNYKIWEIGRATSAAPLYFKAMKLEEDDDKAEHIDGGFGANNPAEDAYRSLKQLNSNNEYAVQVLVGIGTGKSPAQSEATHERVYDMTRGKAECTRLNIEQGLGKMKLDEWKGKKGSKTLDFIRTKTADYLNAASTQDAISTAARQLVDLRRARSDWQSDPDKWERFCYGVEYACPTDLCHHGGDRFPERQILRRHIEDSHQGSYDINTIDELLDRGKSYPFDPPP